MLARDLAFGDVTKLALALPTKVVVRTVSAFGLRV